MKIISFALTVDEFLSGKKTATRRLWSDKYAAKWKIGDYFQVYDKSPRNGGKRIGFGKITALYKQRLSEVSDEDERKEGGRWKSGDKYAKFMISKFGLDWDTELWVIEFEKTKNVRMLKSGRARNERALRR